MEIVLNRVHSLKTVYNEHIILKINLPTEMVLIYLHNNNITVGNTQIKIA